MLSLSCLCGQIRIEIDRKPDYVHDCNCSFCTRAGALWGYFHPSEVRVEGEAETWYREDKDDPAALLASCGTCGAATHWTLTESAAAKFGNSLMGVNMRLADERDLAGVELRYPDGRAWPGHGEFSYVREAVIIGR